MPIILRISLIAAVFAAALAVHGPAAAQSDSGSPAGEEDDVLVLKFDQPPADLAPVDEPFDANSGAELYVKSEAGTARDPAWRSLAKPGLGDSALAPAYEPMVQSELPAAMLYESANNIGLFTPRYANVELGLAMLRGGAEEKPNRRGLDVSLSSTYLVGGAGRTKPFVVRLDNQGYEDKTYSVGMNVGYRGFSVGGSFMRSSQFRDRSLLGYDVGIMYEGRDWSTSVQFGDYRLDPGDLVLPAFGDDDSHRLQLGASYTFDMGLTVSGRLQYFDYADPFGEAGDDDEQVLFLGTNFNF